MSDERALRACTDMEAYLFDLRGYIVLSNALTPAQLLACNATYDLVEEHVRERPSAPSWFGDVAISAPGRYDGTHLQQLYEAGPVWEELIDHPAWFDKVKHFLGTDDPENFDGHHGPAFIDECFGTIRPPGGTVRLHSGGHVGTIRTQYRFHAGRFHCGQVNVLVALTDIGPGDGATMVVPGSHKSNLRHPQTVALEHRNDPLSTDDVTGAVECHLAAGDALLFVDAIAHGSARRLNDGCRRVAIYRYGPSWGFFRHPYRPSTRLLDRLTPQRRGIVMPHPDPRRPGHSSDA